MTKEGNDSKYLTWVKNRYIRELVWESSGIVDDQSNAAGSN